MTSHGAEQLQRTARGALQILGIIGAWPSGRWMRDLIVESKLYFAIPRSFNGALDCRIPPGYDASAFDDRAVLAWLRKAEPPARSTSQPPEAHPADDSGFKEADLASSIDERESRRGQWMLENEEAAGMFTRRDAIERVVVLK